MTIYRKVWEEAYGEIPKDTEGRTYEIHHIDGNRENNSIENLMCVTIQEHFEIHFMQGDYNACIRMLDRMKLTPEEISEQARKIAKLQIKNGTHNFSKPGFQKELARRRVENGTHHWLGKSNPSHNKLKTGTHNFQIAEKKTCEYCYKQVDPGNYALHHGEYCYKHTGIKSPGALSMEAAVKNSIKKSIWITNGQVSKRIHESESIPDGFYRGRFWKNKE